MPFVTLRPTRRIGILLAWLVAAGSVWAASSAAATGMANRETVPGAAGAHRVTLHIAIGSTSMTATLEDNPTARDFAALLPLTVTLREFSPAEKVSGALPRRLSEEGAPATDAGAVGDIAYYAPWGNIAFYRGRGPDAAGVIKIARITSGIEALQQPGQVRVTISRTQ
jgi:hypothetical protein